MEDIRYQFHNGKKLIVVPPMDELCEALKAKFESQDNLIKNLKEENKKLKEDIYEKEEVAKLKERYDKMYYEWSRGFPISEEEGKAIHDWSIKHTEEKHSGNASSGVIGGRYTYYFTPTSIGVLGSVICTCGEKFEFQSI